MGNSAKFEGAWSVYPYFASGTILVSSIERGLFVLRAPPSSTLAPTLRPTTSPTPLQPTPPPTTPATYSFTSASGCLSGSTANRALVSASSECHVFEKDGAIFKSTSLRGQCLDLFNVNGNGLWGLWSCHGNSNQHFTQSSSDQWCTR